MTGAELEQAIIDAIERHVTEENKDEVKKYFTSTNDMTVNDMIDEFFEE